MRRRIKKGEIEGVCEDDDVAELKLFMKCDMNYYIRETVREKLVSRPMH